MSTADQATDRGHDSWAAGELPQEVDLLVIGGGVNGAGIARDAAGRGLSVLLCEKADIAEGTSSRSGKLIHGGLRYLEYYEFRLVREALIEREVLLESAPHIIWPMRFVLPHDKGLRPAWLVRLGLFLYDHLGGRKRLPGTRTLNLRSDPEGKPLKDGYTKAFEYSDCWVDDARLVVLNALDAKRLGATVLTRTRFVGAHRESGGWLAQLADVRSGAALQVRARAIVNSAGPWVEQVLKGVPQVENLLKVRLVKGSHIIVPKFWDGPQAYLVQNTDKRVIFINPYEGHLALIGTTDIPYDGDADAVQIASNEIDYLCEVVNRYFKSTLSPRDVVHAFSGVRPLYEDDTDNPSAVTRDYFFDLVGTPGDPEQAALLSVYGGKITTFRKLAEHAMQKLAPFFPRARSDWTAAAKLPGGNLPNGDVEAALDAWKRAHPWLPAELSARWMRCYGSLAEQVLGDARSMADLGQDFGAGLTEHEVRYLMAQEWAQSADDILWRRTKCGLHMSSAQREAFAQWLARQAEPA